MAPKITATVVLVSLIDAFMFVVTFIIWIPIKIARWLVLPRIPDDPASARSSGGRAPAALTRATDRALAAATRGEKMGSHDPPSFQKSLLT